MLWILDMDPPYGCDPMGSFIRAEHGADAMLMSIQKKTQPCFDRPRKWFKPEVM
ncbi:hypothetical protein NX02_10300 [Sphingomonas sanxanigenens DSM 19645 = NX02]|uniref:Uncharacterized protein n=1 Tax=Sphingomonas sanxanigenens DSM 19645 = NX02 TaxID=1123269 RepID=W0ABA4_9SPHN|nr:hypothetical protein NX02_10300 [Sphingomonas sanxanigenens DSM 19645 = NX02]